MSLDSDDKMESSNNHHSVYYCSICVIKTRRKKAICFCQMCKEYLCSSCDTSHRSQKEKRYHKLVYGSPMILRRNSFRPLTRCSIREIKQQSKNEGISKRSTLSRRQSLVTAKVNFDTKGIRNDSNSKRDKKWAGIDDNDTSGAKYLKRSSALVVKTEHINKCQVTVPLESQSNKKNIKNSERVHTSSSQNLVAEMKVMSKREIYIRFPKETWHPRISCCAFLPSGELVIGDKNNMTLKLLDNTLTPRDKIKLPGPPCHYMAVTSDRDILISIRKLLQFVQILPSLELKDAILLENFCRGLAVVDELIYVIESNENKIRVLDYHGQLIRYVSDNHGMALSFEKPVFLAVTDMGKCYVSEWLGRGVIRCYSSDGCTLYRHEDAKVKYGPCIHVDGNDNIILLGHFKGSKEMRT